MQHQEFPALTDDQINHLEEFLALHDGTMDLEQIDGFFCALISGPDVIRPSEFLPYVFGRKVPEFAAPQDTLLALELLLQHWDHIISTLQRDVLYYPCIYEDEDEISIGNSWIQGFTLGMALRQDSWTSLIENVTSSEILLPILALYDASTVGQDAPQNLVRDDQRKYLVARMTISVLDVYRYFSPQRTAGKALTLKFEKSVLHASDPCYCGSNRQAGNCHGAITIH